MSTPSSQGNNSVPTLPPDATPEEKDAHWYKHVYQGDSMPQLTVRAVLMGGVLGMAMAAANLYTTLSIGWAFGIAITACVMSYVIWSFFRIISGNRISQMSILENACMASTASAAGYSTGSTIATMFGALVLLHEDPAGRPAREIATWDVTQPWVVVVFTLCTGLMGVFLAIPMKRQQINHEQLPFPSGTAAAETLKSLYSASKEALNKAYVLLIGLASGLIIGFLRVGEDILHSVEFLGNLFKKIWFIRIPPDIEMHFLQRWYPGYSNGGSEKVHFQPAGFAFEPSALLIAAGMIVGMRTSVSLVVSSLILYAGFGPWLAKQDENAMARSATAVLVAAQTAGKQANDPESAVLAAAQAAGEAAARMGWDAAAVQKAAMGAGMETIDEFKADQEKARTKAAKRAKPAPEPSADEIAKLRNDAVDAAGGAAAAVAGREQANAPARQARDEARAKALAEGKTEAEADTLAQAAYDAKRYRPNFIWDWAGGHVVLVRWALWGGTSVMVFSSLMAVALQWKTVARAFTGVRPGGAGATPARIEVPGSWMIIGMVPITIAMVWLQVVAFGVSWWAGIIAVAMSFVLSLVASRATGETDTTPIGAMGKVMQLLFAVLAPGNIHANLASAGIAANSASASADLLTDLKTGYLLGANPRRQFLAQFFGVFFGTAAIVPIWYLMVPTREKLESFDLPATQAWAAVARVLVKGVTELPASAVYAIIIGAGVGMALPIIERILPEKARRYTPSAIGVGLAWVMPFQNAFSFFIGAVIAMVWGWIATQKRDRYNIPIASGLIAGESLMLAALAILATVVGLLGW